MRRRGPTGASYFPVKNTRRKSFVYCSAAGWILTDRIIGVSRDAGGCARILLDVID
jgi:hypothetical protein